MVKRLSTVQETWVRALGWEDPLEKEMAIHSSTLAWKIPRTEEPDRLRFHGVAKSQTRLSDFKSLQSSPVLGDPMDCRLPSSSVHGILQARILEWLPCPPPGDLPNPQIKPRSPSLQADSLPSEPPGMVWTEVNPYL